MSDIRKELRMYVPTLLTEVESWKKSVNIWKNEGWKFRNNKTK